MPVTPSVPPTVEFPVTPNVPPTVVLPAIVPVPDTSKLAFTSTSVAFNSISSVALISNTVALGALIN